MNKVHWQELKPTNEEWVMGKDDIVIELYWMEEEDYLGEDDEGLASNHMF